MTGTRSLGRWRWIHRWSSLTCTAFLLLICVTGLPLIFSDEIEAWLSGQAPPAAHVSGPVSSPDVDKLIQVAHDMYPSDDIASLVVDDELPEVRIWMVPVALEPAAAWKAQHFVRFDTRTGQVLGEIGAGGARGHLFVQLLRRLHIDLFAGIFGELFMGSMAALFLLAIVSGIVIYGPFTRKLPFGTVRDQKARRIKWLDIHNLLGVTTLGWALVMASTGIMNELSTALFATWQRTDLQAMIAPYAGKPPVEATQLSSAQMAVETARSALPGMTVASLVFPARPGSTPYHYLLWMKGASPLTSRLFSPVLIDARTGRLAAVMQMPWYLRVLQVSRPLHFGDYGGNPLKLLWVLLDLVTIVVLTSGIYLWLARGSIAEQKSGAVTDLASAQLAGVKQ